MTFCLFFIFFQSNICPTITKIEFRNRLCCGFTPFMARTKINNNREKFDCLKEKTLEEVGL